MTEKTPPPKLREAFKLDPLPESEDAWSALRTFEDVIFEMARVNLMRQLKRHINGVIEESGGAVKDKALHRCIAKMCEHTKVPLNKVAEDLGVDLGQLVYWQKGQSNLTSDKKVEVLLNATKIIDEDIANSPAKDKRNPVVAGTQYIKELK